MMNRLDATFAQLKKQNRSALMPYLPLGYPTLAASRELLHAVAEAGADMLELGVPFSDPLADGPIIQHATQRALQNGMTLAHALEMVGAARAAGLAIPLTLMGYYNPILRFGIDAFASTAAECGVDGLIVPDLPLEESGPLGAACRAHGLHLVFLAAPTSTVARLNQIGAATEGFLYLVSVVGVTGARARVAADLADFVARARAATRKPVCVGFGISNAESARQVARIADGVIVGSALVEKIDAEADAVRRAQEFVRELAQAVAG